MSGVAGSWEHPPPRGLAALAQGQLGDSVAGNLERASQEKPW